MTDITLSAGPYVFRAQLEEKLAPATCAWFRAQLPYRQALIHVRWSGEAMWIPLGATDTGLRYENATSYPAPGQAIVHPGDASETELLIAYGPCRFASKVGQLAGNHFLTITEGLENLHALGRLTLERGAQDILFTARQG